ncbi:MAG: membrane protein required for colicin V production [Rickettsiales bacterium]|jgi:membrane protein required for colicin V production
MEFNTVDGVIFLVIFIFAFLAFLKGFIKDLFATLNLVFATIASYALSPLIADFIPSTKYPQMLVDLGVRFLIFVTILILASMMTSRISKPLSEKIPTAINQSLGFGFGFAKGYFILAFVFAVFLSLYEKSSYEKIGPDWFQSSKSYDLLLVGSKIVKPFTDDFIDQVKGDNLRNLGEKKYLLQDPDESIDSIMKNKKLYEHLDKYEEITDDNKIKNEDEDSGYSNGQMEKLKRLIEIVQ